MGNDHRWKHQESLEGLDRNQKRILFKRAAQARRASSSWKTSKKDEAWDGSEDAPSTERNVRRRKDSIRDWAARLLEQEEARRATGSEEEAPGRPGVVVSVGPGRCRARAGEEDLEARVSVEDLPAPGDEVCLADRGGGWEVVAIAPRRSRLSRPDPFLGHRERVIAANIDAVVVVASARQPHFRPRLVDRYLVAAAFGGAAAIVCVNKADLVEEGEERAALEEALRVVREAGAATALVSAATGEGLDDLRTLVAGRLVAFVGQSGVGKSSLVNALDPARSIPTGEVQERSGKGRHTTTASTLLELPGGVRVIDTPGIRGFGLWEIAPGDLPAYFPEFAACACRFRDCTHVHEPGCGVRAAVEAGSIPGGRFESYLRMLESLAGPTP